MDTPFKEHRKPVSMSEAGTLQPRIFVSHSANDNDFGAKLVSDLQRAIGDNDAVWYDVSGLQGGDEWWDKIVEELTTRDVFIIVLSPNSVVSRWVLRELNTAINEGKRIVPVLYQPCKVRADLKTIQIISFLSPKNYDTAFNELLSSLGLLELPPPPPLPPPPVPPVPGSPIVPKPGRSFSPIRVGLFVGLALLLIAGGVLFFFAFGGNNGNHAPGNAQLTSTSQAYAATAATFQARINATATATMTFGASLSNPYPIQGTLALDDPLSQPDNNWGNDSNSSLGGACQFTQGAYHISQYKLGPLYSCAASSSDFSNFAFEVQMTIIKGDCGGIQVRLDSAKESHYNFEVCQNRIYFFRLFIDDIGAHVKMLRQGSSFAIHTGLNQSNVIAVVANGSSFDLYVNHQKIDSAHDSTFSHGEIALFASADSNPTEVVFRNAKVWIP